MLVRKCDVCGHISENEVGYSVQVTRLPPVTSEKKSVTDTPIEMCCDCYHAVLNALNERMTKYGLMGKGQWDE